MNKLAKKIHKWAKSKGWYDKGDRNVPELLFLAIGELAEAGEELRNGHSVQEIYYSQQAVTGNQKPEGFPIEVADCIIRLLDMCGYLGIDIEEAIKIKMAYNEKRPYRHGNKKF